MCRHSWKLENNYWESILTLHNRWILAIKPSLAWLQTPLPAEPSTSLAPLCQLKASSSFKVKGEFGVAKQMESLSTASTTGLRMGSSRKKIPCRRSVEKSRGLAVVMYTKHVTMPGMYGSLQIVAISANLVVSWRFSFLGVGKENS